MSKETFKKLFFDRNFFHQQFYSTLDKRSLRKLSLLCKDMHQLISDIDGGSNFYSKNCIVAMPKNRLEECVRNYETDLNALAKARGKSRYEFRLNRYSYVAIINAKVKPSTPETDQKFFNQILGFYFKHEDLINTFIFSAQRETLCSMFHKPKLLLALPDLFHKIKENFNITQNLELFIDSLDNVDPWIKVKSLLQASHINFSRYQQQVTHNDYVRDTLLKRLIIALETVGEAAKKFIQSQQNNAHVAFKYPPKQTETSSLQPTDSTPEKPGTPMP